MNSTFYMGYKPAPELRTVECCQTIMVPLQGYSSLVKKKDLVVRGDVLAKNPQGKSICSPCTGVVVGVDAFIRIEKGSVEKDLIPPIAFAELPVEGLRSKLLEYGCSFVGKITEKTQLVLCNGVHTDVGQSHIPALLSYEAFLLEEGVRCLQLLASSAQFQFIVPEGTGHSLGSMETVGIAPEYPYTMSEILQETLGGEYPSHLVSVVDLMELWILGSVFSTGYPLERTVCTIGENVVKAPVGSPIIEIFEECGVTIPQGATVVSNGLMRGEPLTTLDVALVPHIRALHVLSSESIPATQEEPCVNCGACTRECPKGLKVHLLNQYAERSEFEKCIEYGIQDCIECGMCAYACIVRRPLLQYLRYAKEYTKNLLPMGA